ncbi:ribosome-associated heat shock protein Hsp15 [Endozoicomonas sp. SM1973]|uniref:Heat shock protein 15 n=1 Tax=Spartinivicinus marinus TaxID=2994442 RepID=A0A853I3M1_9GAMM|nr:ribosome-associated heat shock protein Hsp15 [Spartinivicinus marinus]MCX4027197.1 ribosome-associated heat shock protein Hsp15 [Spartinivicinus marinus]NYZ66082.1 ribosome-associated heat shock protein Hsp15 [Spartinivicinus marinus]
MAKNSQGSDKVRLDKWLWAARFFKTRNLAKEAIEGGKVHYNGIRTKPSKEPQVGDQLTIRQGWDERIIIIKALSEQRRGAPEAQLLYEETAESISKREAKVAERKSVYASQLSPDKRPTKKQRRDIRQFKDKMDH